MYLTYDFCTSVNTKHHTTSQFFDTNLTIDWRVIGMSSIIATIVWISKQYFGVFILNTASTTH